MKLGSNWRLACACGGILAVGAVVVTAGPLAPPAGPVASTYKTLSEVEPRVAVQSLSGDSIVQYYITQPGSYYLTGKITGVSGKKGIAVLASNVTIDLCGFSMEGAGVGDDAIFANSGISGLTVRNGIISDWVKEGVDGFYSNGCTLESLQVRNSVAGYGLITGTGSIIRNCAVSGSAVGIVTTPDCAVIDCTAQGNTSGGFLLGSGSTATRCAASASTTAPAPGFSCADGVTLANCTARANNGYGIDASNDCTITQCTSVGNVGGIRVANGGVISASTASRNTGAYGIVVTGAGTTIQGCTVDSNSLDGIRVASNCLVLQNTCNANGNVVGSPGSGIFTTGSGNRLDSNLTTNNLFVGIALNGSNNFMVRNLATGNIAGPNQLIAGNRWAQIINNPAGGFVSTDPWANVQY